MSDLVNKMGGEKVDCKAPLFVFREKSTILSGLLARAAETDQADTLKQHSADLKISRLQELKEKEKVYKESYTLVDDLVLCLRCLLD